MEGLPDRHLDLDPRPRRSPRLFAHMDSIPGAVVPSVARAIRLTDRQRDRLARDLAIYLALVGGMSQRTAARAFGLSQVGILKAYRRIDCHNSRV